MSENAVPIRVGKMMNEMPATNRTAMLSQGHTVPVPK
jgi:hypothetical protein